MKKFNKAIIIGGSKGIGKSIADNIKKNCICGGLLENIYIMIIPIELKCV